MEIKDGICIGTGIGAFSFLYHLKNKVDGHAWTILEKSRGLGGRLATRRLSDNQPWNMGPSFFSSTDEELNELLKRWKTSPPSQLAAPTFSSPSINSIPKTLWQELFDDLKISGKVFDLKRQAKVISIEKFSHPVKGSLFETTYEQGGNRHSIFSLQVVMNAPIPQALGWKWIGTNLDPLLGGAQYHEEDVRPASDASLVHHWKYANIKTSLPGFFYYQDRIGFVGDGFSCNHATTRDNGIFRAWKSGRTLAENWREP